MNKTQAIEFYAGELEGIRASGLWKGERYISTKQSAQIEVTGGQKLINMCANNYLGLADSPELMAAAKEACDRWGYGVSSVRFICGTQELHKQLEAAVSKFLGTEDTILYSSCFDANGGLFETLLGEQDAVISDELNHASIIDGVRLCKAKRFRYKNNDMADLRAQLIAAKDARIKLIATDGVFSMDGIIANLKGVCDLADEFGALVMVDDSHSCGFIGKTGRGTAEYCGVQGRVDVTTGTFGKALGGASGGFTSGRAEIIALLRQRSRPYLFSNTLAPMIAGASLRALEMLSKDTTLRDRLEANTAYYRELLTANGFDIIPGVHPIVPVMLYDERKAAAMAERLLADGIYAVAFSFPVVPRGKARIRTQVCAKHTREELKYAVEAFVRARDAG